MTDEEITTEIKKAMDRLNELIAKARESDIEVTIYERAEVQTLRSPIVGFIYAASVKKILSK